MNLTSLLILLAILSMILLFLLASLRKIRVGRNDTNIISTLFPAVISIIIQWRFFDETSTASWFGISLTAVIILLVILTYHEMSKLDVEEAHV